jgi:gentisate 1,2-dioxygenase
MSTPLVAETAQAYSDGLESNHLVALWQIGEAADTVPLETVVPYVWRWSDYNPYVVRSGQLMQYSPGAERRAVRFVIPGLQERSATTHTMVADIQLLLPGEVAAAHRHMSTAVRFIVDGDGAYTTVEGQRCYMHRYDLVLNPSWTWHDHGNGTDVPMSWLDVLDVPLMRTGLHSAFFEPSTGSRQQAVVVDAPSLAEHSASYLQPAHGRSHAPTLVFPWEPTRRALDAAAPQDVSAYDDIYLEYTRPHSGEHLMSTMACYAQKLRPGVRTRTHRHNSSAVYYVVEGEGTTFVEGQPYDWQQGDVLALPSWSWHCHANRSPSEAAVLVSITDRPVYDALCIYLEEASQD